MPKLISLHNGIQIDIRNRVKQTFLNTLEWAEEVSGRAINMPGTVDDRVMLEILKFFGAKLLPEAKYLMPDEQEQVAKFKLVILKNGEPKSDNSDVEIDTTTDHSDSNLDFSVYRGEEDDS